MHQTRKLLATVLIASALTFTALPGCADRTHETTRTTTIEEPAPGTLPEGQAAAARRTTTTTTNDEDEGSPGVIGSAFQLVGAIILFPFKVIGATLGALF